MPSRDDDLNEVDPLLADYVDAFREDETPPQRAVEQTWAGIETQTRRPFPVWIPVAIVAAAAVIVVALMDPGSLLQRGEDQVPEQVPYSAERSVPVPETMPVPKPVAEPESEPEPEPEPDPESVAESESVRVARRPRVEPETGPSALARETALIGEIRRAQAAGRYAEVVLFTGQHAKRFPKGAFADERSLARARALCRLGKTRQARKVSERFVSKHPNSYLVPQFEGICPE